MRDSSSSALQAGEARLRIGSLFSGIGGLELGLERSGLGHVAWQCEVDPWCRKVLKKHWPRAVRYGNVRAITGEELTPVDVICGGFPCQDVSFAGKRRGLAGKRSGLWAEFYRVIEEVKPAIVVIENVLGLRTAGLSRVLADLAALGFDAEWSDLAAADVGAPHLRRRLFIGAFSSERTAEQEEPGWLERACRRAADAHRLSLAVDVDPDADGMRRLEQARSIAVQRGWPRHVGWELDHPSRMDDGFPAWVDVGSARKALGNAVVPQCAEVVGRAILSALHVPKGD